MKKLLIICAIFSLLSCGSRKRALDKTSEKTELSVKNDLEVSVKKDTEKEVLKEFSTTEIKSDTNTTFEGKVADTTKAASIEESVKDGVKKTVFKNFKDVKTSSKSKKEDKSNLTNIVKSEIDKSETDLTDKGKVNTATEVKKKTVAVERESGYSWIMWLIVSLAVVAYGYFSVKKKTANPLSWFS